VPPHSCASNKKLDSPSSGPDKTHDEQDEKNEEANLGYFRRGESHSPEPQNARDQGYHQKN
jgi:hypothetical protein